MAYVNFKFQTAAAILAAIFISFVISGVEAAAPVGHYSYGGARVTGFGGDVQLIEDAQYALVVADGRVDVFQFAPKDINGVTQFPQIALNSSFSLASGARVRFVTYCPPRGIIFAVTDDEARPVVAMRIIAKSKVDETSLRVPYFFDDQSDVVTAPTSLRGAEISSDCTRLVLYGNTTGMAILNITDEARMTVLWADLTQKVQGVRAVQGVSHLIVVHSMYNTTTAMISVVDISAPSGPIVTTFAFLPSKHFHPAAQCEGLGVFNTSSEVTPIIASIACRGAQSESFLFTVDMTTTPPTLQSPLEAPAFSGRQLYATTGLYSNRLVQTQPDRKLVAGCAHSSVFLADMTSPISPRLLDDIVLNGTCFAVSIDGPILVVSYRDALLRSFLAFYRLQDFTALANAVWREVGSTRLATDDIRGMWRRATGGVVFTASTYALQVSNFSATTSPTLITNSSGLTVSTNETTIISRYAHGNVTGTQQPMLFVAELGRAASRIIAFDLSAASAIPRTKAQWIREAETNVAGIAVAGGSLYVFRSSSAAVHRIPTATIDLSTFSAVPPTTVDMSESPPDGVWNILVAPVSSPNGLIAIAVNTDKHAYTFSETRFLAPRKMLGCNVPLALAMSKNGERLYVACVDFLHLYRMSSGKIANELAAVPTGRTLIADLVEANDGTTLYVAADKEGLVVVDVSVATKPVILGSLRLAGSARRVATLSDSDLSTVLVADRNAVRAIAVRSSYYCIATVASRYFAPATTAFTATLSVGEAISGSIRVHDAAGREVTVAWVDSTSGAPTFMAVDETNLQISGTPTKSFQGQSFLVKVFFTVETAAGSSAFTTSSGSCWAYFAVRSSLELHDYTWGGQPKFRLSSPSSLMSLKITLANVTAGRFVTSAAVVSTFGAIVVSFDKTLGTLSVLGTLGDINAMLARLRFSVDEPTFAASNITIVVDDTINVARTFTSNLTVFAKNAAPSLNATRPLQNFTADQGRQFSFFIDLDAFVDPDDSSLTFKVEMVDGTPLPSWVAFFADRGEIRGMTAEEQTIHLAITADDGYKNARGVFSITISNPAPELHIRNVTWDDANQTAMIVKLGRTRIFQFPEELFSDDDAMSYQLVREGGAQLPPWIMFDATTRQVTLREPRAVETVPVVYSASDGFKTTTLRLNITAFNAPPQVVGAFAPVRVKLGTRFSTILGWRAFSDADDGTDLTYTLISMPSFASFDSNTRTFAGSATVSGNFVIGVVASDGFATAEAPLLLEVYNAAPRLAIPMGSVAAKVGQSFSHGFPPGTFIDDDDELRYAISAVRDHRGLPAQLPASVFFDAQSLRISGVISAASIFNITVTATDGFASVDASFILNASNVPPIIVGSVPNTTHKLGVAMTISFNRSIVHDGDDAVLSFSAVEVSAVTGRGQPLPRWLLFDAVNLRLSGAPLVEETIVLELQASDGFALASMIFSLRFTDEAPVVASPITDQRLKVGRSFEIPFAATFTDADDATLSYTLDMTPKRDWLSIDITSKKLYGVVTLPSTEVATSESLARDYAESFAITLRATDGFKAAATTFTISAFDNAPRANATLVPRSVKALTEIAWRVPPTAFYDPDGDPLTVTTSTMPAFATFDHASRTVSGQAPVSQLGTTHFITITASDGYKSVSAEWKIVVLPNGAPSSTARLDGLTWYVNEDNTFAIPSAAFRDPDNDTLTFSAASVDDAELRTEKALPGWMQFDAERGVLMGKPGEDEMGSHDVVVTARDPYGAFVKETVTVTVRRSVLETFFYALEVSGIVGAVLAPIITIYGMWTGIVNTFKGASVVVGTNPFDQRCGAYKLEHTSSVENVRAYRRDAESKLAWLRHISHHWYNCATLTPLKNGAELPPWLAFEEVTNSLHANPDAILPEETAMVVLVTTGAGVVLSEIAIDPHALVVAQKSALTALNTANFASSKAALSVPECETAADALVKVPSSATHSDEGFTRPFSAPRHSNPAAKNGLEDPFLL